MKDYKVLCTEINFKILTDVTMVSVHLEAIDNAPKELSGWRYQSFGGGLSVQEILNEHMWQGVATTDPIFWSRVPLGEHP